jgi:hypothetical protein
VVAALRWLLGARGAVRPGVLVAGGVAASAVAVAVALSSGGGATAGTANLWIDTTGGTCTRQADAGACSSIQAAIAASSPGDTARMKAGSYGSQSITSGSSSPGVTVIAEDGTTAGGLSEGAAANWHEIDNVTFTGGWDISNLTTGNPHNITLRGVNFQGRVFLDDCCTNLAMIGGSITGVGDAGAPGAVMVQGGSTGAAISNITFDGVEFANNDCSSVSANHYEVVRINAFASNITIRNSYFHDNGVNSSQIFASTNTLGHVPGPILIEGNYFDSSVAPSGCNHNAASLVINGNSEGNVCPDETVQYNTSPSQTLIGGLETVIFWSCSSGSGTNVKMRANLAVRSGPCQATYNDNVWISGSSVNCGTGDETVASTAAAGLTGDGFHISGTSVARGNGYSLACPSTDRDGDTRPNPNGSTCDAGADEVP